MKEKLLAITLTISLIASYILLALPLALPPSLPVFADKPPTDHIPPGQQESLPPGWERANPNSIIHKIGTEIREGIEYGLYEAIIDSLPATLDDNETLIDTNWYLQTDISGQSWFESGVNIFTARVLEGRISVEDENGRLAVWDSTVYIGNTKFTGGPAKITDDPLNENYKGNCLLWEYGNYKNGWWFFGDSAPVNRYLRVIEGHISELWILPINPKADVTITLNELEEGAYGGNIEWLNAYDADGEPLSVTLNNQGDYVIKAREFSNKEYPITIDPTQSFTTSASDGDIGYGLSAASYTTTHDAGTATVFGSTSGTLYVGQNLDVNVYRIWRTLLYFDTSGLPNDCEIDSAILKIHEWNDYSYTDFNVVIQSGMPTYPHDPLVAGDYYYANYGGNGGQLSTSGWSFSYQNIDLSATGLGWISKTGTTKFCLRSSRDIAATTPTAREFVAIGSYEKGSSYQPKLEVSYHLPVTIPVVTTISATGVSETYATLKGYLSDDGGETCSVRFEYGGSFTAWVSGYTSGQYFEKTVYGLTPGVEYSFRVQALNSAGTGSGSYKTFTTPPYAPTLFTATGGDATVSLTWTKGTGAEKTMVRRSTTACPTSPTSGTQIYFDVGTSKADNTVVNDTKYYYSTWSWAAGVYSASYMCDDVTPSGPENPTVTTNAATAVTATTATLNLNLDNLGGYSTCDVWFQYYTGAGSWTDNETTETEKTAPGSHSAGIDTLAAGTLYHVRAAATNAHGTSYGSDVPFTTNSPTAPTMLTQSATSVDTNSATLRGKVTADGNAVVTGSFQYGLTTSYELGSTSTTGGLWKDDTYNKGLTSLDHSTTYHYRAVGQNSAGYGYGADLTFTTDTIPAPEAPTNFSATAGDGEVVLTWTKGSGAEKTMIRRSTVDYPDSPTGDTEIYFDTGTSKTDSDVVSGTPYYYSAWSWTTASGYSDDKVSDYAIPYTLANPSVTTNDATSVGSNSAKLKIDITNLGGYDSCYVWFQYGLTVSYGSETTYTLRTAISSHSAGIINLAPSTAYHFRAVGQNTHGTTYGDDKTFTTNPPNAPAITTQTATGVQMDSATLNAVVTNDGGSACTVWFEWGLTTSYGASTPSISGLITNDIFYYGLGDLDPGATYHYRAAGQNTGGIGYGDDEDFITQAPTVPTVRTDAAAGIGANQATLKGTLLTDGGVECEVRFQWGLTTAYGTDTEWTPEYSAEQTFEKLITGLTVGESYHFRAQAKNDGGTGSGEDKTFTTVFSAPLNFRAKAISATTINLEWLKQGDQTHIRYKQTGFPVDRADGNPVYLGPDEFASISGLPGITYYFRAWSWREGDVWSSTYADDVATTQATVPPGEEEMPGVVRPPEMPGGWFQVPSGAALEKMPLYAQFNNLADSYGIPQGSLWLVIAMVITMTVTVITYRVAHNGMVAVIVGGFAMAALGGLGMLPYWFLLVYAIIGGGLAEVSRRRA